MHLLSILAGFLLEHVHAATVDNIGKGGPGIDVMWSKISEVLPFFGVNTGGAVNGPLLIASKVIRFVASLIGGVAVAILIYAGLKIVTSHGNDEALNEAKKMAIYALGGVILFLLTEFIIGYVVNVIGWATV